MGAVRGLEVSAAESLPSRWPACIKFLQVCLSGNIQEDAAVVSRLLRTSIPYISLRMATRGLSRLWADIVPKVHETLCQELGTGVQLHKLIWMSNKKALAELDWRERLRQVFADELDRRHVINSTIRNHLWYFYYL